MDTSWPDAGTPDDGTDEAPHQALVVTGLQDDPSRQDADLATELVTATSEE